MAGPLLLANNGPAIDKEGNLLCTSGWFSQAGFAQGQWKYWEPVDE
jgi:hypothetical protein